MASQMAAASFRAALQDRHQVLLLSMKSATGAKDRTRQAAITTQGENEMAIDVYLQIDGIKGESADSTHQGWIEVAQAQWGVTQPILHSPGSTTGGRTTGRSEYRTLSLAKLADLASPVLM
jgi:hypothetical protein